MNPQELRLEHIAPYAQYALKGEFNGVLDIVTSIDYDFKTISSMNNGSVEIKDFKPELRSLSDLTKEIEHNGNLIIPIEELQKRWKYIQEEDGVLCYGFDVDFQDEGGMEINVGIYFTDHNGELNDTLPYWVITELIKWHFDINNLIPQGLAIDFNQLKLTDN